MPLFNPSMKLLCATLGPSLRTLVDNFRAGLSKSVSETFRAGSNRSQVHPDASVHGITLFFLEGAALHEGGGSSKDREVVDLQADAEAVEL